MLLKESLVFPGRWIKEERPLATLQMMMLGSEVRQEVNFELLVDISALPKQEWLGAVEAGNLKNWALAVLPHSVWPEASVLQRDWMRWSLRSSPAVTFWKSMNSKDTRQVRADCHVGSSHLSVPSVSAPHFQQCQTPGLIRVQLPILKLFKDSRPFAQGSFQPEAGLPSSLRLILPQATGLCMPLIHFCLFAFRLKLLTRTKHPWWWDLPRRAASFRWGGRAVQKTKQCANCQLNQERKQETVTHTQTYKYTHFPL